MKLRPYQAEAIEKLEDHLAFDSEEAILLAPTSWGKSVAILELVRKHPDKHITIMVNISKLITQLRDMFKANGISCNVIKAGLDEHKESHVTIAMQQTLASRLDLIPPTDYLLIDERHHMFSADTTVEIINRLEPEMVIGFSATPVDGNGAKLPAKIIKTVETKELTRMGFLTPVRTFVAKFSEDIDFSEVDVNAGDYSEVQLGNIVNTPEYNQQVVDNWKYIAENKKTIVFASGVDHANDLAETFKANGYDAMAVHSKQSKKDNERIMQMHRDNVFPVLVSINMIAIGYDDPSIECGIGCRPTKTWRLYIQMVGRIMRLFKGKTSAVWLDFAQNTREHGLYDDHYDFEIEPTNKVRLKEYKDSKRIKDMSIFAAKPMQMVESRRHVELIVEEIKNSASTIEQFIALFESSDDIREIIRYAVKIDSMANYSNLRDGTDKWIIEPWLEAFEKYPDRVSQWTRAFKTMAKNKIKQKKKLAGLRYSIDWLIENMNQDGWVR